MFVFIQKLFIGSFGQSNSERLIKCVSLNNQPYQARAIIINTNSNEPL